jgi:hypothetical protein
MSNLLKKIITWVSIVAVVGACVAVTVLLVGKPANAGTPNNETQTEIPFVKEKTFKKAYDATNYSYNSVYDAYTYYSYSPTVITEPFKTVTFDFAVPFDNFYQYSVNEQAHLSSNGSLTLYDASGQLRISYSFSLYKENDEQTRVSASLTSSINNSAMQYSRSISSQIVTHTDTIQIAISHDSVSFTYNELKLELLFEKSISIGATASTSSVSYSTIPNENKFFDMTFVY